MNTQQIKSLAISRPKFIGTDFLAEPYYAGSARISSTVMVGNDVRLVLRTDIVTNQTRWGFFTLKGALDKIITIDWQAWGVAPNAWGAEKQYPKWSYDGINWNSFDNRSAASTYVTVYNNAKFNRDIVYISIQAPSFYREYMDFLKTCVFTHRWVSNTASTTNFIVTNQSIYSTLDTNQGVIRKSQPFYGFKFQKTGTSPTKLLTLTSGIHAAGEAGAKFVFWGAMEYILYSTDSEAETFRNNFILLAYPHLNPTGELGGFGRASGDDAVTDCNRILDQTTPSRPHMAAFKAAIVADIAAIGLGDPSASIDLHQDNTYTTTGNPYYLLATIGSPADPNQKFYDKCVALDSAIALNPYAGGGTGTVRWLATNVLNSTIATTVESGTWLDSTVLKALGVTLIKALVNCYNAGDI